MPELTEAMFGRVGHARKIEICKFAGSALRMREKHEAKESFSEVSQREHRIHEAACRIDLRNQSAVCKNVSCSRESMTKSIDRAPAKPSPVKRRHFQMF